MHLYKHMGSGQHELTGPSLRRSGRNSSSSSHLPTPMPEVAPKYVRNVKSVVLGDIIISPWYSSLYREDLVGSGVVEQLYVCSRCFKYTTQDLVHVGHMNHPHKADLPGHPIYKKGKYSIMEVDGAKDWLFTTNISLFAKLFIDNKSVCFDVDTFMYYLLIDNNVGKGKSQIIGFFSKEKLSWDNNNLACIVVFPPWQKKGLGQILMGASYEIGKREGQIGGPERPLSTPGERGYYAYWSCAIARYVLAYDSKGPITVRSISDETYMRPEDIILTLKRMEVLGFPKKDGSYLLHKKNVQDWIERTKVNIKAPVDASAFIEPPPPVKTEENDGEAEEEDAEQAQPTKRRKLKPVE